MRKATREEQLAKEAAARLRARTKKRLRKAIGLLGGWYKVTPHKHSDGALTALVSRAYIAGEVAVTVTDTMTIGEMHRVASVCLRLARGANAHT